MITRFIAHKSEGKSCVFMPSNIGLFYFDIKDDDIAHVQIYTVDKNITKYAVNEYTAVYTASLYKTSLCILVLY